MSSLGYNDNDRYAYLAQVLNLGLEASDDPIENYQKLVEYQKNAPSKEDSRGG